jgi:hypothetical protein
MLQLDFREKTLFILVKTGGGDYRPLGNLNALSCWCICP